MDHHKMLGFEVPGDQRVTIPVRDWQAMKLALWRSRTSWTIVERAAREVLQRCEHAEGCPGLTNESAPCLGGSVFSQTTVGEGDDKIITSAQLSVEAGGCPDRELRMSALVILNAARQFAPLDASRPAAGPYYAPSREHYADIMASLGAAQAELTALRGSDPKLPPPKTV